MIHNKKFYTQLNGQKSGMTREITNGLQQGTVTAPTLFNIYNADLPQLFEILTSTDTKTIQFADDLIIYIEGKNIKKLQDQLQKLYNQTQDYYNTWKLKINARKCETILFRRKIKNQGKTYRNTYKAFQIRDTNTNTNIPHKDTVKYLGVHIDKLVHFNEHINTQLQQAAKAFQANGRIFYSKILNKRIKTICYLLLIRPIVAYGGPI